MSSFTVSSFQLQFSVASNCGFKAKDRNWQLELATETHCRTVELSLKTGNCKTGNSELQNWSLERGERPAYSCLLLPNRNLIVHSAWSSW